jgi:tRNA 2-thiocytidine biosynthesis protein TtcA
MAFPIIPCNLCGSQENLQRKKIKQMLEQWECIHPGRKDSIFAALQNISPSQLADRNLFDFVNLGDPDAATTGLKWLPDSKNLPSEKTDAFANIRIVGEK